MADWKERFYTAMATSEFGTINEVCKAAGVASSTFGNALKGSHTPKIVTMEKVAKTLGITWQYLMNGEDKDLLVDTRIPVLDKHTVVEWMAGIRDSERFTEWIFAPIDVPKNSFVWKVATMDMEPIFPQGSYAIMTTVDDSDMKNVSGRDFVLAARSSPEARHSTKPRTEQEKRDPTFFFRTLFEEYVFAEMVETINGMRLVGTNEKLSSSVDIYNYFVVAHALYSIQRL